MRVKRLIATILSCSTVAWFNNYNIILAKAEIEYYKPWTEVVLTGKCGDNLKYELSGTYEYVFGYDEPMVEYSLTITGSGEMYNYDKDTVPWGKYARRGGAAHSDGIIAITLPNEMSYIGNYAFHECAITEIDLPTSLTAIGDYGLSACYYLESLELPNNLETIGDYALQCVGLKELVIPDSVTDIGENCFLLCTELESISLSESLTVIRDSTFRGCLALKELYLPDGVETIEGYAISGCDVLESVVLPESVKKIYGGAFSSDYSLKSINIPKNVEYIGTGAFSGCKELDPASTTVNYGISYLGKKAFPFDLNFFKEIDTDISVYSTRTLFSTKEEYNVDFELQDDYSTISKSFKSHSISFMPNSRWSYTEHFFQLNESDYAYNDGNNIYIFTFGDNDNKNKLCLNIPENTKFGAICCDNEHNYYILYFLKDEIDYNSEVGLKEPFIFIDKVNSKGVKVSSNSFNCYQTSGHIVADDCGNPSISYHNGKIAVLFTCLTHPQWFGAKHQDSNFIMLSSDDLSVLKNPMSSGSMGGFDIVNSWFEAYASHSFEQFILPVSNGFMIAQKGDGNPRAFKVTKIYDDLSSKYRDIFHFTDLPYTSLPGVAGGYNSTYANLGGIAEGCYTYGFAAASEKELSLTGFNENPNEDVFVRVMHKTMNEETETSINGEDRISTGQHDGTEINACLNDEGECDTKIIWLTSYTDENADNVKIAALSPGGYIVLWEKYNASDEYENTYYAILDDDGNIVKDATLIADTRLSTLNQPLQVYDGVISWCTVENGLITKYSINTNEYFPVLGDVNCDGAVGIADVVLLQKWLLAVPNTNLPYWKNADLCKDDKLDVFDLCLLRQLLIEKM